LAFVCFDGVDDPPNPLERQNREEKEQSEATGDHVDGPTDDEHQEVDPTLKEQGLQGVVPDKCGLILLDDPDCERSQWAEEQTRQVRRQCKRLFLAGRGSHQCWWGTSHVTHSVLSRLRFIIDN
jgi:hypothetical protein